MEKKLIGYRLLKDLPSVKAGAIYKLDGKREGYYNYCYGSGTSSYKEAVILNVPEWFERVEALTLILGEKQREYYLEGNQLVPSFHAQRIDMKRIELFYKNVQTQYWTIYVYSVEIDPTVRCLKIGCDERGDIFSLEEIKIVLEAWSLMRGRQYVEAW